MKTKIYTLAVLSFLFFNTISFAEDFINENIDTKNEKNFIKNNDDNSSSNFEKFFSFKEILEYTYYNNDTINAEKEKTKSVSTQKLRSYSGFLPEIGAELNYGFIDIKQKNFRSKIYDNDGKYMDNKIYLEQPIFKSGRTYNQVKIANKKIEIQKNNLFLKEEEVLFNTINAIINLIKDKKILELTKKNEESFKNSYEYIRSKKKVGRATASQLALAESRYSFAKTNTILANTNYISSKTKFLRITKLNPDNIDVNFDKLFNKSFEYILSFDDFINEVLSKNPTLQVAKNNYELNRSAFNLSKTSFLPELYFNAQYGRQRIARLSSENLGSISLNLRVPFFQSGIEYADYKEKSHSLNESKFSLNDVKEQLIEESTKVYDEFLSSKNLISSNIMQRDASRIALNNTIAEEIVGKSSLIDILDRRIEYFENEISLLNNKTNLIMYYYTLKMLMGNLNLDNIENYNE